MFPNRFTWDFAFVVLGRSSGDVSSIPRKVRGTLVSWANNSVGIQSCPTPPRHSAVRPDPTRPWYVWVLDSTSFTVSYILIRTPGHALLEKGLQRQKGAGPLVSSQEERALLVPLLNRLSTAGFVPPPVYIGFPLFVLPRRFPDMPCMKRVYRDKASVHWSAARNKERSSSRG